MGQFAVGLLFLVGECLVLQLQFHRFVVQLAHFLIGGGNLVEHFDHLRLQFRFHGRE